MKQQHIAIIGGTGDQGKGLALRWAQAGFAITVGSRDAQRAQTVAAEFKATLGGNAAIDGAANAAAAASAEIVVLTVPFAAQIATLKDIAPSIKAGTLLIDVTVPLEPAVGGRSTRLNARWRASVWIKTVPFLPRICAS